MDRLNKLDVYYHDRKVGQGLISKPACRRLRMVMNGYRRVLDQPIFSSFGKEGFCAENRSV